MKKLFICFTASLALISSLAMAKTEGNSVGVNLINTNLERTTNQANTGASEDDSLGFGIDVTHARNLGDLNPSLNNVFVSANAFLDFNEAEASGAATGTILTIEAKNSFGLGLALGYDINEQYAVSVGLAYIDVRDSFSNSTTGQLAAGNDEAIGYTIGLKYAIDEQYNINLSYNVFDELQEFTAGNFTATVNLSTIKLGASYNF